MNKENQAIIKALNMYGRVPQQWELLNEVERLNNIINELTQESLQKSDEIDKYIDIFDKLELYLALGTKESPDVKGSLYWNEACEDILERLNELKGDSSNE